MKILAIASIYWGSPLESIGGVVLMLCKCTATSVVLEVEIIIVHGSPCIVEILASTSIYWGSPLDSIRGVVLILVIDIYINFSSLGVIHWSP